MNVALENEIMGLVQGYFAPLVGKGTSKGMLGKIYSANVLNNTALLYVIVDKIIPSYTQKKNKK